MSHAAFVWANLRRRPLQVGIALLGATLAFTLFGLTLGLAGSIRISAAAHHVTIGRSLIVIAIGLAAAGLLLIVLLLASAASHAVRVRQQELATLAALGFSHLRIFALIAAEAAAPCLCGLLLGLLVAKLLFAVLAGLVPQLREIGSLSYTPGMLGIALAAGAAFPLISTAWPMLRFARRDVAAALGHQRPAAAATPVGTISAPGDRGAHSNSEARPGRPEALDLRLLRQIGIATRIGLSTLHQRLAGALLIVGGVGIIALLLLSVLSGLEGVRVSLLRSGDPAHVVLRAAAAPRLTESRVPEGIATMAADAPGVARAADGAPIVDTVISRDINRLVKRNNGKTGYTMIVGVGAHWRELAPRFRLLKGRMPRPGSQELIAGTLAQRKFSALDVGTVDYRGARWHIVGTFATDSWWDGYLVGDATDLKAVARTPVDSGVLVKLASPEAFGSFQRWMTARLPPNVVVERETDYYAGFWRSVPTAAKYVLFTLCGLIAGGVITGVMLILQSALEERRREIATLRVLGFDAIAVAASVVLEALLLATLGALTGAAIVWLCFDGFLYNGAWNVCQVDVDGRMLLVALGWGTCIALLGALPVAIRILRQSELEAIQTLRVVDGISTAPRFASTADRIAIAGRSTSRYSVHAASVAITRLAASPSTPSTSSPRPASARWVRWIAPLCTR